MKYSRVLSFISALWLLSFTSPGFAASNSDSPKRNSSRYQLTVTTAIGDQHQMEVIGWSHEVVAPRDAASGLPTGKRQHKPFNVTKAVDKASPLILNVLTNNENITSWELKFWKPSRRGKEGQIYKTVTLTSPGIVGVVNESPHEKRSHHVEREHVLFTYKKIKWYYHESGVTVEDEWQDEGD